jgi:adenine deaminase
MKWRGGPCEVNSLEERISVASGEGKADLLLKNGRVIDVFTGGMKTKDVAIFGGVIVGFGPYPAKKVIDLAGDFLCPGLIDGHVHIESSMVTVPEFARAVLPHGTTTVITDPHEIANVLGVQGIRFMAESAKGVPLNVYLMLPSCVPATEMETSGAVLTARHLAPLLNEPSVLGLAEVMNFPGVILRDPEVLRKIRMAKGRRIDGHAPSLTGKGLHAYLVAGIHSDHECTGAEEASEKVSDGMWIMIRQGSTARNLKDLLRAVNPRNARRFLFVTDDRHPKELLEEGHINGMVREAIASRIDPLDAIRMATLNTAEYFRLDDLGAIAPGYRADLITIDDPRSFRVRKVFKDGKLVAQDGKILSGLLTSRSPYQTTLPQGTRVRNSMRMRAVGTKSFVIRSLDPLAKVIEIIPGQIVTRKVLKKIVLRDGIAYPVVKDDVLKIAVLERHHRTGHIGLGFVTGFGLKRGAIGSSVAHDSHNVVVLGTNDEDLVKAAETVRRMEGGLVAIAEGKVLASVPLPIAGLMSTARVAQVNNQLHRLQEAVRTLGCNIPDPFMTLSFLSLPVIPELKITDRGLVDVTRFRIVPLFGME